MANPRLNQLIERFGAGRILVAGDLMLDEFIWGNVSRISPEAPVPVVEVTSESYYPGGAANVARNVREFGAATHVAGSPAPIRRAAGCSNCSMPRASIPAACCAIPRFPPP